MSEKERKNIEKAEIQAEEAERQRRLEQAMRLQHAAPESLTAPAPMPGDPSDSPAAVAPFVRGERKVGRNELCPCGSGKKFKHCHGALAGEA